MATIDLVFEDCEVVTPASIFHGWVSVDGGRIIGLGNTNPPPGRRTVRGEGRTLFPGRIEPHCHLRAVNFAEDVAQVSQQAAAGGVTLLMPYMRSTRSYLELVPEWSEAVKSHSVTDLSFHLQIQAPHHTPEITECYEQFGIRSYKVHLDARHNIADFGLEPVDDGDLYFALLAVRAFDGSVSVHCENTEIARHLNDEIRNSGRADLTAWAEIRSPIVEAADVNSSVFLASELKSRLVVVHASTEDSIIAGSKHGYPQVKYEVMIHSLTITADEADSRLGGGAKTVPPLRSGKELERLWTALFRGEVDFLGTDHSARSSAVAEAQQEQPVGWWEAREAATGVGVGTPLFLSAATSRGLDLREASRLMSGGPASAFRLDKRKGSIAVGMDADLMLVDRRLERTVAAGTPWSPVRTLADGLTLTGWPVMTCVRGEVVFEGGEIVVDRGLGEVIRQD